jgi:hypothetical protein
MALSSHQDKRTKMRVTKRPPNAFLLFCRDERPRICERCPNMNPSDVSSLLSHLWRSLAEEAKVQYKEEERRLQCEYRRLSQEYMGPRTTQPSRLLQPDFRPSPMPFAPAEPPLISLRPRIATGPPPTRVITRRFDARPVTEARSPSELEMSLPQAPMNGIAPERGEGILLPS